MTVSDLPLLVEQRVCGVEISDLPCLVSGHNSNPIYEDMADLRRQGMSVNDNNDPAPENSFPRKHSLNTTGRGENLDI